MVTRALVIALALVASCFVDRRSGDFECERTSDCDGIDGAPRACNNNVCVRVDCPDDCDSCSGTTCIVNCTNATKCADFECPNGFACAFNCTQDCRNLECDDGCVVQCSANADCGPIDCGAGETCACNESGNGTCL